MFNLGVMGSGGNGGDARMLSVDVQNDLVIGIPAGAKDLGSAAFGVNPLMTRFIAPGTNVTWVNNDTIAHRIHTDGATSLAGILHEPNNLLPGATYTQTVTKTGTFPYSCHIHPAMTGVLVVAAPAP
jgi:plastocyanin